jgi:hypothetical protein
MEIEDDIPVEQIYNQFLEADHCFVILLKGDDIAGYIKGDSSELAVQMKELMDAEAENKEINITEPLIMLCDILIQEHCANSN